MFLASSRRTKKEDVSAPRDVVTLQSALQDLKKYVALPPFARPTRSFLLASLVDAMASVTGRSGLLLVVVVVADASAARDNGFAQCGRARQGHRAVSCLRHAATTRVESGERAQVLEQYHGEHLQPHQQSAGCRQDLGHCGDRYVCTRALVLSYGGSAIQSIPTSNRTASHCVASRRIASHLIATN